MVTVAGDHGTP